MAPATDGSATRADRDFLSLVLLASGVGTCVAAAIVRGADVLHAMARTADPFLALAAIIGAAWLVDRLGAFRSAAAWLLAKASTDRAAIALVLVWTALLSGLINLDVAVVVGMPLGMEVAARRGLDGALVAIAVANVANAASILFPTSNLTTLLILGGHWPPSFVANSWLPWLVVVVCTVVLLSWLLDRSAPTPVTPRQGTWSVQRIALDLLAMYLVASGVRSLLAGGITLHGSFAGALGKAALLAGVVNNLPAAAAIHAVRSASSWAAILGTAIGPNLILTGSVATVICRRLARERGSDLPILRFTAVGAPLLVLQLGLAWAGLHVLGAI